MSINATPDHKATVTVTVFHNVATDDLGRSLGWGGWEPEHEMVEVFSYKVADGGPLAVLGHAFWLLNVGDDPHAGGPDPTAVRYRAKRLRSLSVGDVLVLGPTPSRPESVAYACARIGWTEIPDFDPAAHAPASGSDR